MHLWSIKEQHKATKIQAYKAKHMKLSVREYFIYHNATALVGQVLLIVEGLRSHSETSLSVGIL